MAAIQNVTIYTQAMNTAFIKGYEAIAEVAPIQKAILEVPSNGRVENYPWMYPPPLMHQWKGYRQFATLGVQNYAVPNITYTAEFEILLEDFNDDQVSGFKMQAAAMGKGANEWKWLQSQINLANGQTVACFDGSNFFASSHSIGTGNNIVTGTASSTDGVTHAAVFFVLSNRMVKPLLWQLREAPSFRTDAGSDPSDLARLVRNWTSLRGAAAFGFWYDACLVKWSNTPTVQDMQTTLGSVNAALRTFTYPKNLPTDVNQYIHGQTSFSDQTCMFVVSSKIEHIARQALTLSLISQTENYYRQFASLVCSGYLDGVV